jgi:HEAT repeat protein
MFAPRVGFALVLFALVLIGSSRTRAADGDKLEALAKELKSKNPHVRLKAAQELGKLGPKAADVAKGLCDAVLDPNLAVSRAAFQALEKVQPELHKPLTKLVFNKTPRIQIEGARELAKLGPDAEPAAFLIVRTLAKSVADVEFRESVADVEFRADIEFRAKEAARVEGEIFAALLKIGSEDPDVIAALKVLAGPDTPPLRIRAQAMELLVDWAAGNDDRHKELLPLIKSGLETPGLEVPCCGYAARYGALSKDLLPTLKLFQFSRVPAAREAAARAIATIEADLNKK